jgi:hypothetical protein
VSAAGGALVRTPFTRNQIPVSRLNAEYLAFIDDTVPALISTGVPNFGNGSKLTHYPNFNQIDSALTAASQQEYSARVDHTFGEKDFIWAG